MSPCAVLWLLVQAGRLLENFRPSAGDAGWWDLFELDEYQADREEIETLLEGMNDAALEQAIAALSDRQEQILAGRRRRELPTEDLNAHLALGALKQILEARRVRIQLDPAFVIWLLNQALPALERAAPKEKAREERLRHPHNTFCGKPPARASCADSLESPPGAKDASDSPAALVAIEGDAWPNQYMVVT